MFFHGLKRSLCIFIFCVPLFLLLPAQNPISPPGAYIAVPYNNGLLFAPDCAERNGKYCLYYCHPDRLNAEGVAIDGMDPPGPFGKGQPINTCGYNQIDPAVFTDDDDTAYYLWGQFSQKMAIYHIHTVNSHG